MDFNGTAFGAAAEAGYPLSMVPLLSLIHI